MNRLLEQLDVAVASLRVMPGVQLALRAALLLEGAFALLLSGWHAPAWGMAAVAAGAVAVLVSLVVADSLAPACAIGFAVLAWLLRWGLGQPPLATTLVLAVVLYLFHTTSALVAALPPAARVDTVVLTRWFGRTLLVLVGSVVAGTVALVAGRTHGTLLVDLGGLVGVVGVAGLLVLLAQRGAGRE